MVMCVKVCVLLNEIYGFGVVVKIFHVLAVMSKAPYINDVPTGVPFKYRRRNVVSEREN